jgi:ribosomal protein L32
MTYRANHLSQGLTSVIIRIKFQLLTYKGVLYMGQPKKQSSPRKTGLRRSHLRLELARRVNATSPVKARTTRKESGKSLAK